LLAFSATWAPQAQPARAHYYQQTATIQRPHLSSIVIARFARADC
jgi:hypothetical protein